MSTKMLLGMGLLAFALLCFFCINYHGPALLASANNTTNIVTNLVAPGLQARLLNGKITLSGVLPDQAAKDQVMAEARKLYGEGQFIDELRISNRVGYPNDKWLPATLALLPLAKQANSEGGFAIEGGAVTVRGMVDNDEAKNRLIAAARNAAAPLSLIDRVVVKGHLTETQAADFQAQLNAAITGKIVEFEVGKDVITDGGKEVLNQMVTALQAIPGVPIEIGGHTDARGNANQNMVLSQRRAEACMNYLTEKGVATERLSAKGYGATKPITNENSPEGLQRNRRTEFTVMKEAK